jgi:hypothetical protein
VVVVVVVLVVSVAVAVADGGHSDHVYGHDLLRLSQDYGSPVIVSFARARC